MRRMQTRLRVGWSGRPIDISSDSCQQRRRRSTFTAYADNKRERCFIKSRASFSSEFLINTALISRAPPLAFTSGECLRHMAYKNSTIF